MSSLGERVKKERKEKKDLTRKGVLEALLKVYTAKEMAGLEWCPLCENRIDEYTWTIMDPTGFKTIGLSGVQCSNQGCLLHNGIIYESEAKRLAEWQGRVVYDDLTEQKKIDEIIAREAAAGVTVVHDGNVLRVVEKDPNRFKWQLAKDKKEIRETVKGLAERMEFSDFGVWPVGAGGKTVSMKFEMVMVFDYSDYHGGSMLCHEFFRMIGKLGYEIVYVFVDWQNKKVKIMIEKKVDV